VGSLETKAPDEEVPEFSVPRVSVTSCKSRGYCCKEALTASYCEVNAVVSVANWVWKLAMVVVRSASSA
jgi:hypothetical protein